MVRNPVCAKKVILQIKRVRAITMNENSTFLIVGLGNPGREHQHNRHNVGFMVIDTLARSMDISMQRIELHALVGKGTLGNHRVILAKPQTYMNKSGLSVASLVRFYKISLEQTLVIHDDLDLPFETIRLRPLGGTGGQKGMESIVNQLGTRMFPRLRVGIGRPPGRMDPADYVLHDFNPDQQEFLPEILNRSADAVRTFIVDGIETAMNIYNIRLNDREEPNTEDEAPIKDEE